MHANNAQQPLSFQQNVMNTDVSGSGMGVQSAMNVPNGCRTAFWPGVPKSEPVSRARDPPLSRRQSRCVLDSSPTTIVPPPDLVFGYCMSTARRDPPKQGATAWLPIGCHYATRYRAAASGIREPASAGGTTSSSQPESGLSRLAWQKLPRKAPASCLEPQCSCRAAVVLSSRVERATHTLGVLRQTSAFEAIGQLTPQAPRATFHSKITSNWLAFMEGMDALPPVWSTDERGCERWLYLFEDDVDVHPALRGKCENSHCPRSTVWAVAHALQSAESRAVASGKPVVYGGLCGAGQLRQSHQGQSRHAGARALQAVRLLGAVRARVGGASPECQRSQGRAGADERDARGVEEGAALSLIHISEPTRRS
eukprot:3535166-Prymnesium_polylepis.1